MNDPILDLGITLVLFLQTLGGWLVAPMRLLSYLGNEEFYLFIAPAIYWCVDAGLGLRMGLLLMLSNSVNWVFKVALRDPRPYWYDARVKALSVEGSFGAPSGHAQNSVAMWGSIGAFYRQRKVWAVMLTLIFLIGISRLVLGVHFPSDVLLGWLLGALVLGVSLWLERPILSWLKRQPLTLQLISAFAFSVAMILVGALLQASLSAWTLPLSWVEAAARARPEADPLNPIELSGLVSFGGAFFGMAAGGILAALRGGFDSRGPLPQRFLRFLLGVVGVGLIWFGLGEVFPRGEYLLSYLLRFLRYLLVGIWIAWIAPLIFARLGLGRFMNDRRLEPVKVV